MIKRETTVTINGREAYVYFTVEDGGLAFCCHKGEYWENGAALTDAELDEIQEECADDLARAV